MNPALYAGRSIGGLLLTAILIPVLHPRKEVCALDEKKIPHDQARATLGKTLKTIKNYKPPHLGCSSQAPDHPHPLPPQHPPVSVIELSKLGQSFR